MIRGSAGYQIDALRLDSRWHGRWQGIGGCGAQVAAGAEHPSLKRGMAVGLRVRCLRQGVLRRVCGGCAMGMCAPKDVCVTRHSQTRHTRGTSAEITTRDIEGAKRGLQAGHCLSEHARKNSGIGYLIGMLELD